MKFRNAAIIIIMIGGVFAMNAQEFPPPMHTPPSQDTLLLDSLSSVPDSLAVQDTTQTLTIADSITIDTTGVTPLYEHGRISLLPYSPYRTIRKNDIQMISYTGISDIIHHFSTSYPLSTGYFAQFNHYSLFGSLPQGSMFLFNGRPVIDLEFQSFNPQQFPVEFAENVELLAGSEASILAGSESGNAINIQERRYNSRIPYTHLWYNQGGGDFLAADGVFSRNIRDDMNINLGFRVMNGRGEYTNQWIETWNVRAQLRWNPDNKTSISLIENFTNQGLGTNGGLNHIESIASDSSIEYHPFVSNVMYEDLNERNHRHDLTLSASRFLSPDSLSSITANFFYSRINWNRQISSEIENPDSMPSFLDYVNHYYGVNGKYEQNFANFILRFGGEIIGYELPASYVNELTEGLNLSAFGHISYDLSDKFTLGGGYRFNRKFGNTSSSFGGKLFYKISPRFSFLADVSAFERIPSPAEGNGLSKERNLLSFAEFRWSDEINYITVNGYYRLVDNPLVTNLLYDTAGNIFKSETSNIASLIMAGAAADLKFLVFERLFHSTGKLFFEAKIQGNIASESRNILPQIYSLGRIYYELRISKSLLHLGISGSVISGPPDHTLFQFNRTYGAAASNPEEFMYDGLSAFASARLGNAFVRVGFDNVIGADFYYLPIYPILPRNFRLSVSWSFFD